MHAVTPASADLSLEPRDGGTIAVLTVSNPAKLNTLDSALMRAFIARVDELRARDDLRALVVTGAGTKAFVGGASIDEMACLDRERAEEFIGLLHRTCDCLRALPVPVIARIDGYALGAGLELAASCDLRVASSSAVFGMPEVKVGIPSVIEAALLPGLIGWGRTRLLLMLGENIDAEQALRWGLVEKVVPREALDEAVDGWVRSILATGARAARLQKKLMRQWEEMGVGQAIEAGVRCFSEAWATDEPARMMGAFLDRRRRSGRG